MEREDWNRRYETPELLWTAEANRFLVAEVETMPPGRALDVGTGEGRNAVWLAERGWQVTGVDFSDIGLAKARRLAEARGVEVDWVLADLRTYQPEVDSYDLVVVLYLHLSAHDRASVLAACGRALGAGGVLVVIGHHSSNLTEGCGGPQDPGLLFTPDDVLADLADVGDLSVVRAERVTRPVVTEAGKRTAIDALVRVSRVS
jgi:SAM-dependent methyltransferase